MVDTTGGCRSRGFAAVLLRWTGGALALASLLCARPARAQDDDGRWNDGSWSGDEGSWESGDPQPGAPRDGYAPRDEPPPSVGDDYAPPQSGPSIGEFQESLSPYGQWIDTSEYGRVWRPTQVDGGWRPYSYGRWAWTNAGWFWVADEPFGWAVYHYGRWALLSDGWAWVPGQRWAPAWVSWRWGEGYAGWCPLGPRGAVYVQPEAYVIVPSRHFLAPVQHYAVPIAQGQRYFPATHALPVMRPGPRAGPVVSVVEGTTGRPIRAMPVADASVPPRGGPAAVSGGVVFAYRPRTVPLAQPRVRAEGAPGTGTGAWRGGPTVQPEPYGGRMPGRGPVAAQPQPAAPQGHPYFGGVPARGIIERTEQAPATRPAPVLQQPQRGGPVAAPPRLQPTQPVQQAPHVMPPRVQPAPHAQPAPQPAPHAEPAKQAK